MATSVLMRIELNDDSPIEDKYITSIYDSASLEGLPKVKASWGIEVNLGNVR